MTESVKALIDHDDDAGDRYESVVAASEADTDAECDASGLWGNLLSLWLESRD
jgi:hypothetical protein